MDIFASISTLSETSLQALNILFHILHLGLLAFVIIGLFFSRLIRFHFPVLVVIWFSWTVLGLYIGTIGYCPLTDWHWQVKRAMGEFGMPPSYIDYIIQQSTGTDVDNTTITLFTMAGMLIITIISGLRYFHWRNN